MLECAVDRDVDVVVLGGDLAPRSNGWGFDQKKLSDFMPFKPGGAVQARPRLDSAPAFSTPA